jgi:pilus assembly protein CpaB
LRRRILAAVAAVVLAVFGALVLVGYARGADQRAMAGMKTAAVFVVSEKIPTGTPGDQLAGKVRLEALPAKAAAPGRVTDLHDLEGKVATVDLQPGEQLLASRFSSPDDVRAPGTVAVPKGDQEISILLDPQRAVGGRLKAGDKVGIFVSLKSPDGSGLTHLVLHGVLVTQVQGAPAPTDPAKKADTSQAAGAPAQSLMVTFALTAKQAEPVVFGQEHGTVWLSLEPDGADNGGTSVIDNGNVYTEAYQ